MTQFRITTFIALFFIGFYSFQTVAQVAHTAQHAVLHVQSSEKSASQQINNGHTKAHECPYCSFFKEHAAKIIFATSSAIIFENLPDLVVPTNLFLAGTVLIFHSARAPPAIA